MLALAQRDTRSNDPLLVCLWNENPNRLVSLWDILKQFNAFGFAILFQALLSVEDQCDAIRKTSGGGAPIPDPLRDQAYSLIGDLSVFLYDHGFKDARDEIQLLSLGLGREVDASTLRSKLEGVNQSVVKALQGHKFWRIESERSAYFENPDLLGPQVAIAFPLAISEIVAAGNCFAFELYSAAVFHLVRVSEYGLRDLAQLVGITLTDKGQTLPIEFADRNKILIAIKNKLSEVQRLSKGPERSAEVIFYSEGAERCSYLQELRNEVSHMRKTYNYGEALGVFERIKGFMAFLAERP